MSYHPPMRTDCNIEQTLQSKYRNVAKLLSPRAREPPPQPVRRAGRIRVGVALSSVMKCCSVVIELAAIRLLTARSAALVVYRTRGNPSSPPSIRCKSGVNQA